MHRSNLTPRVLRDNLALAIVLLLCVGGQATEKPCIVR